MIYIRIPGTPVTKKNSMQMAYNPKTKRWFPVPSKAYRVYEKSAKEAMANIAHNSPIDSPVEIICLYYLPLNKDGSKPKKKPDLTNLLGATDDILVKYNVISDDNIDIIYSHDGSRAEFTDAEPRTEIFIYEKGEKK